MKKIYLVWFRWQNSTEDIVRGCSLNWERAERMALNLELILRAAGKKGFTFGVKSYEHGSMSYNIEDDGCFGRWTEEEFGEE